MSELDRQNREAIHTQGSERQKLFPSSRHPIAIAWGNMDIKPTMDVTTGAPHVMFIGATAAGILPH